jgi:hypothetical protein
MAQSQIELFPRVCEIANESGLPGINHDQLGRYAEFLVCAEITKLGYFVVHCPSNGFDLLLIAHSKPIRVQVKSTSIVKGEFCLWKPRIGGGRREKWGKPKRSLTREDADLFALYHHTFNRLMFVAVSNGAGNSHIQIRANQLMSIDLGKNLAAALAHLNQGGGGG